MRKIRWLQGAVLIGLISGALIYFQFGGGRERLESLILSLQGMGGTAALGFILIFWLTSLVFLPLTFLMIASGIVFGFVPGLMIATAGAVLSAGSSFLLGRTFLRSWVQHRVARYPVLQRLDDAVNAHGWKAVALSRFIVLFPFTLVNCSFGTTRIPLAAYLLATGAAMLPGTALWVLVGTTAGSFSRASTFEGMPYFRMALIVTGLAVSAAVTFFLARLAQKELRQYGVPFSR